MPFEPKIFGIGLSKTGTTSLFAALDMLGFRTITYRHLLRLGLEDWRSGLFSADYLEGVEAATDLPIGTYFRELDALYPGSKFILTERPLEPWLASMERQFTTSPEPTEPYRRDVRFATYGVARFNRARFARVHAEHAQAVRAHFAGRPDDLLIQNYFDGDGWEGLCAFLRRPIPDAAFPNVQPGYQTPTRLAFAIALVHPDAPTVSDYTRVEAILRETLASLTAQEGVEARVVVVGHRRPDWHDEVANKVIFLTLPNHSAFAHWRDAREFDRAKTTLDKGIKWSIGLAYALKAFAPHFLLPFDGDDFARRDLGQRIASRAKNLGKRDGFLLTGGYHAALLPRDTGFDVGAVIRVLDFHSTCGSCRVFAADPLARRMADFLPGFSSLALETMVTPDGVLGATFTDGIVAAAQAQNEDPNSFFRTLARHVAQDCQFKFLPLTAPLVAKGCGHGNHVGPRAGAVHWHRALKRVPVEAFLSRFGLAGRASMAPQPNADLEARAEQAAAENAERTGRRFTYRVAPAAS
jgi:hypothetical protein